MLSKNFHYVNVIHDVNEHTMEEALNKYMQYKIHQLIHAFQGKKIVVRGKYERALSSIYVNEKKDKMFNWKRPTAEITKDGNTLYLNCFPGHDYVYHYASIVSSYLKINSIKNIEVVVEVPKNNACIKTLLKTNLPAMPNCDIVILGMVEKLHHLTNHSPWQGDGDFCWSEGILGNKKIILLGCKFSFWGDIAGNLVKVLASKKVKAVIYTGKLGGLQAHMQPNLTLATGSKSIVNGKEINWKNILSIPPTLADVIDGVHYTLPSVLYEDKNWFDTIGHKYSFVDPEIGWMAKAAKKNKITFSYMHIVSDNLAKTQSENLSNERDQNIVDKRLLSAAKISEILKQSVLRI
jgi:hypothetical protein